MLPIVFYFPYPSVGGVSILFIRLAELVSQERTVFVMDLEEGYMARHLPENCEFIPYNKPQLLPEESVVIVQSCPLWRIPAMDRFPSKTKIFYWNLHPYNLSPLLISSNPSRKYLKPFVRVINGVHLFRKRKLRSLVSYLHEKRAIYFMDRENADKTKHFLGLHEIHENYLPIMTGYNRKTYTPLSPKGGHLKCVWVGRLDDFKVPILLHTIRRLDQIETLSVSLDIIGDGEMKQVVSEGCNRCTRIRARIVGSIQQGELEDTLAQYHLLFAMGTSALEGAKLALPTVCVDFSYGRIDGLYRYKMIYENRGFNVGEEITRAHYERESTLEGLLNKVGDNYQNESHLSFEYWDKNHNPATVHRYFIDAVEQSDCRVTDLLEMRQHKADVFTQLAAAFRGELGDGSGFVLF